MQNAGRSKTSIKIVFDKLGETLEYEKTALKKMNVDSLLGMSKAEKIGLIVLAASFLVWFVVLLMLPTILQQLEAQILLLTNMVLVLIVMAHKLIVAWRMRRTSVRQSVDDIYKRSIGNWVAGKELADITDVDTLSKVELLLKSEMDEFQARGNLIINTLKNMNPFLLSLAVLFGIFGISTGRGSVLAIVIAMVGTTANLVGLFTEVGLQPEIIRCKQCLSIIAQAKAAKESNVVKQGGAGSSERPAK